MIYCLKHFNKAEYKMSEIFCNCCILCIKNLASIPYCTNASTTDRHGYYASYVFQIGMIKMNVVNGMAYLHNHNK